MSLPSHPILSCAEAKAWEAKILRSKDDEFRAMFNAGVEIADAVMQDIREIGGLPEYGRVLALVGKGHNGGDVLLAVQDLLNRSPTLTCELIFPFGTEALRPLPARVWKILQDRIGVRMREDVRGEDLHHFAYDLCLDGIFGMQFRLPLDEKVAELIARVNTLPRIRFRAAIDLPSGLGEQNAGTVFRADFTYATGILKSPLVRPENAPFVGRVRYLDLGFFGVERDVPGALLRVLTPDILAPLAALRASQTDKRTYGHLFLVGGSLSYPGAIVLAARAALRSGVGLVTAFVPEPLVADCVARHPEIMWVGMPINSFGAMTLAGLAKIRERISRATALAIGPGLSAEPDTLALAAQLVEMATVPLVLDADALRPEVVQHALGKAFIVTPHAGELQRIASILFDGEKLKASFGVIVAKGPLTRIIGRASPGSPPPVSHHPPSTSHVPTTYYSPHGGPVLARGGSGDLLAGLIGGLLAQSPADPLLVACRGVVWHGRSADLLARARGQVAVEISELLEHLGPALIASPCQTSPP